MRLISLLRYPILLALLLAAAACHDESEPRAAGGSASPAPATPPPAQLPGDQPTATPRPSSPTVAPSSSPAATARPSGSSAPASTRVDGTVSPLNFGSTDPVTVKSNPDPAQGIALLTDVRIGVHPEEGGWERIVFEFRGHLPAGAIAYAPSATACGSGAPVTPAGAAILTVRFMQTAAHDDAGRPTIPRGTLTGPGATIRQAQQSCDFEGVVAWALGVSGTQRFKVTTLSAPPRVIIDVKQ